MTPTRRTLTGGEGAPVEHVQLAMAPCDVTRYVATRVFVFGLVEGKVLETFHCASRLAPADIVTMRPLDYTMQLTALQVPHGSLQLQGVLRPGTVLVFCDPARFTSRCFASCNSERLQSRVNHFFFGGYFAAEFVLCLPIDSQIDRFTHISFSVSLFLCLSWRSRFRHDITGAFFP